MIIQHVLLSHSNSRNLTVIVTMSHWLWHMFNINSGSQFLLRFDRRGASAGGSFICACLFVRLGVLDCCGNICLLVAFVDFFFLMFCCVVVFVEVSSIWFCWRANESCCDCCSCVFSSVVDDFLFVELAAVVSGELFVFSVGSVVLFVISNFNL